MEGGYANSFVPVARSLVEAAFRCFGSAAADIGSAVAVDTNSDDHSNSAAFALAVPDIAEHSG